MIPKFNYDYAFTDLLSGIKALFCPFPDAEPVKKYFDSPHLYFTNHARTGLRLLLSSLSSEKTGGSLMTGRQLRIGVQVYNCHTVFQAVKKAGHMPVFLDIKEDFTLNEEDLRRKEEQIDALIVNHTFGVPANFDRLKKIVKGKPVIEDCAHSLFSTYRGRPTGCFGDAAVFSFGFGKYPSVGKGGMTLLNNRSLLWGFNRLYEQLPDPKKIAAFTAPFRSFAYAAAFKPFLYGTLTYPLGKRLDSALDFTGKYSFNEARGSRAAVSVFLKKFALLLEGKNRRQRGNGRFLFDRLRDRYTCVVEDESKQFNYYLFPLKHPRRDQLVKYLHRKGIEAGKHFVKSIQWAKAFGYEDGSCPFAEQTVREVFVVPVHYNLTRKQPEYIVRVLNQFPPEEPVP